MSLTPYLVLSSVYLPVFGAGSHGTEKHHSTKDGEMRSDLCFLLGGTVLVTVNLIPSSPDEKHRLSQSVSYTPISATALLSRPSSPPHWAQLKSDLFLVLNNF